MKHIYLFIYLFIALGCSKFDTDVKPVCNSYETIISSSERQLFADSVLSQSTLIDNNQYITVVEYDDISHMGISLDEYENYINQINSINKGIRESIENGIPVIVLPFNPNDPIAVTKGEPVASIGLSALHPYSFVWFYLSSTTVQYCVLPSGMSSWQIKFTSPSPVTVSGSGPYLGSLILTGATPVNGLYHWNIGAESSSFQLYPTASISIVFVR